MTTGAVFTDTSYFQAGVNNKYPHDWISFRICDGNFRDPKWSGNYQWAKTRLDADKLVGVIGYCVYRPGTDTFSVVKSMVGTPHRKLVVMIDVESWSGEIRGDHSPAITTLAENLAAWLGDHRRVLVYANRSDFDNIYPRRPAWLKLVVASYGGAKPSMPNMIGWQYTNGQYSVAGLPRSSAPFGPCDHNVFPGLTAAEAAVALGIGPKPPAPSDFDLLEWIMSLPGAPKGLTYSKLLDDIAARVTTHPIKSAVNGKPYPRWRYDQLGELAAHKILDEKG